MNLINRATQLTENVMSSGKSRVDDFRAGRRRNGLLRELGELTYRRHSGDAIDAAAIEALLAALDRADTDVPDEEVSAQADGADDTRTNAAL